MTERRAARRYDLSLPVIIRVPLDRESPTRNGKTRDISTRGVYFTLDQDLEAGTELDITLTLPAEITRGTEVFVRAQGKVVRVEKKSDDASPRIGVAAVIERYDIIRGEPARI
ncbi:MAG: PilZ domain-containing protein [Acidobacteria bacterium]|nr:PilZ domain-containing protein [Acidobacteriota bacterium]